MATSKEQWQKMNGKFSFKAPPDGCVDKTKVICSYCCCELSYHWRTSSFYHLLAKPTANANAGTLVGTEPSHLQQTMCDSVQGKPMGKLRSSKLSAAIAKWVTTACRPVNTVENEGQHEIKQIASNDCS